MELLLKTSEQVVTVPWFRTVQGHWNCHREIQLMTKYETRARQAVPREADAAEAALTRRATFALVM